MLHTHFLCHLGLRIVEDLVKLSGVILPGWEDRREMVTAVLASPDDGPACRAAMEAAMALDADAALPAEAIQLRLLDAVSYLGCDTGRQVELCEGMDADSVAQLRAGEIGADIFQVIVLAQRLRADAGSAGPDPLRRISVVAADPDLVGGNPLQTVGNFDSAHILLGLARRLEPQELLLGAVPGLSAEARKTVLEELFLGAEPEVFLELVSSYLDAKPRETGKVLGDSSEWVAQALFPGLISALKG